MNSDDLQIIEQMAQIPLVQLIAIGGVLVIVAQVIGAINASRFNNRLLTFIGSTNSAIDLMRESVERNESAWTQLVQQNSVLREQEITAKDALSSTLRALNTSVSNVPGQVQAGFDSQQTRLSMELAAHRSGIHDLDLHVTQIVEVVARLDHNIVGMRTLSSEQHAELISVLVEMRAEVKKIEQISNQIEEMRRANIKQNHNSSDRSAGVGGGDAGGIRTDGDDTGSGGEFASSGNRAGAGRDIADGERDRAGVGGGDAGAAGLGRPADGTAKRADGVEQSGG